MALDQREQGETRRQILELLRRRGEMTAAELSELLGIGAVGVRQHLAMLERDDLVETIGVRRGVGRPSHLFALTPVARALFPNRYDQLVMDALSFVAASGGQEAVDELFAQRREKLHQQLARRLTGESAAERIAMLAVILNEQGYMCDWQQCDDGSFVLTEHNCPVDCVAREYPQACSQELKLSQDVLDMAVTRDSTIAAGANCCRYHIEAPDAAG
jgi:predicted ArsR family transcriptional regulator